MKSAFDKNYKNTFIHYSVKANSNIHILKIFNEIGAGTDCSSPIEVLLSEQAGFDFNRMLYTGNYESEDDFKTIASQILMQTSNSKLQQFKINLDDISSLKRLLKVYLPEQISFRINPGIGRGGFEGITTAGADAKFGVPYEMALEAYQFAKNTGIKRFGIHMMTGSNNLEPYYFAEIVDKLMMIAGNVFTKLNIIPEYVDIGGGWGVPYDETEPELDIELAAKLITEAFEEKCDKFGFGRPNLILEPGRYLIANAGYLICKVTGIKKSYKTFIGLNAGMNTLIRPALYGAKHRAYVYGKDKNEHLVNLCGQICENSDIFATNLPFPIVDEGDIVIFLDAGAYCYSMSSNYNNRLRPPEVLIDKSEMQLIRKRESFDDILRGFVNL